MVWTFCATIRRTEGRSVIKGATLLWYDSLFFALRLVLLFLSLCQNIQGTKERLMVQVIESIVAEKP